MLVHPTRGAYQDPVGDLVADWREPGLGTNPANPDTFNVGVIRGYDPYRGYGDGEYAVMLDAHGQQGDPTKDWSKGGRQW
jgi:hypothetical protein